jgi:(4S)-4-hydroxy-5-phosphonooxypentane-2,3-dione isomerase
MFALLVSLQVKPDMDAQFQAAIEANSRASRRDEPGCRRFDVIRDAADPGSLLFSGDLDRNPVG